MTALLLALVLRPALADQSVDIDLSTVDGAPTHLTAIDASTAQNIDATTVTGGLQAGDSVVDDIGNTWSLSRDGLTLTFDSPWCNDFVLSVVTTEDGAQADSFRVETGGCEALDGDRGERVDYAGYIVATFNGCGDIYDAHAAIAEVDAVLDASVTRTTRRFYSSDDQWWVELQISDHTAPVTDIADDLDAFLDSVTLDSRTIDGDWVCESDEDSVTTKDTTTETIRNAPGTVTTARDDSCTDASSARR